MTDPATPRLSDEELVEQIRSSARESGFELAGVTSAATPTGFDRLRDWLRRGYAGRMQYLPDREHAYEHPEHVLPNVRSLIVLAMNYRSQEPNPTRPGQARVARYAWGRGDYHDILRDRMKPLAALLHRHRPGCRTRTVVDTAPLLERDFARLAGLGWFGKNTMLINKRAGSWLLLSAILTDVLLPADAPHATDHCGTCTRCLDICPTDAFPEAGVLDARKCISYLTIELRDRPIPPELREGMQDWLFGCDLCQEVCPWNRKAPVSGEDEFQPSPDLNPADAATLLRMSPDEFLDRFRQTPLDRPGRAGLLRNAAIAIGNSRRTELVGDLLVALHDEEPLVRGACAWAIGQLAAAETAAELQTRLSVENNAEVRREITLALERLISH